MKSSLNPNEIRSKIANASTAGKAKKIAYYLLGYAQAQSQRLASAQSKQKGRKADRDSEIINVPMPRSMAKRLAEMTYEGIEGELAVGSLPKNASRERVMATVAEQLRGTDFDESIDLSIEEYRVFKKALVARSGRKEVAHV